MKTWVFVFYCSLLGIGFLTGVAGAEDYPKRIVCNFWAWTHTYKRPYNYGPGDIPTELCTDVVFNYLEFSNETFEIEIPDRISDVLHHFTILGSSSGGPNLLVKVWTDWSDWSSMTSDASKRSLFVASALRLVRERGLGGLDLNWDFPYPEERENLVKLVEELEVAFKPFGLLLTSSVYVKHIVNAPNIRETAYDIQRLSELLDWMNVKVYSRRRNDIVDVPTPLYQRPFDVDEYKNYNVHHCLEVLGNLGAPRHKLVVVLDFFGESYTLLSSNATKLAAPVNASSPKGKAGPVTHQEGFLAYYEICRIISIGGWTKRFDHEGKCPYAFLGDQWVGYEDELSIRIKMDYVRNRGYGGAYVRLVNYDDFNGFCGSRNPLLHAVHEALMSKKDGPTVDSQEVTLRKRYDAMGIVPTCKTSTRGVAVANDFPKRIVCNFKGTLGLKPPYNYGPEDIPTEMCTDVVFDSLTFSNETFEIEIPDEISDMLHQFTTLGSSSDSPNLLVRVSIYSDPEIEWSTMASDASKRSSFVASALRVVRERGFAGLDLNWNYPNKWNRKNFVKLVEVLHSLLLAMQNSNIVSW